MIIVMYGLFRRTGHVVTVFHSHLNSNRYLTCIYGTFAVANQVPTEVSTTFHCLNLLDQG